MQGWASSGLKFSCTQCGKCCKGRKVLINPLELSAIAEVKGISLDKAQNEFTDIVDSQLFLKQKGSTRSCVFLDESNTCSVYANRPTPCATYPFWESWVRSRHDWVSESFRCEGINHVNGELVSEDDIVRDCIITDMHSEGEPYSMEQAKDIIEDLEPELVDEYREQLFSDSTKVIHRGSLVSVAEVHFAEDGYRSRTLSFNDRPHLIQSESYLNDAGEIDPHRLAMELHRTIWRKISRDKLKTSIVFGGGGYALPHFLNAQGIGCDVVESSEEVLDVAKKFFNASVFTTLQCNASDVIHSKKNQSYELVILDVEPCLQVSDQLASDLALLTSKVLVVNCIGSGYGQSMQEALFPFFKGGVKRSPSGLSNELLIARHA